MYNNVCLLLYRRIYNNKQTLLYISLYNEKYIFMYNINIYCYYKLLLYNNNL